MADFALTAIDALWSLRWVIAFVVGCAVAACWYVIRTAPLEQYPGQYDAALAPELIAKRDRTWAEADEFWDDDKFWASIADAIHELERKGDVA